MKHYRFLKTEEVPYSATGVLFQWRPKEGARSGGKPGGGGGVIVVYL
jgi:hypothetical protein